MQKLKTHASGKTSPQTAKAKDHAASGTKKTKKFSRTFDKALDAVRQIEKP